MNFAHSFVDDRGFTIDNRDYVKWIGNGMIYPRYA